MAIPPLWTVAPTSALPLGLTGQPPVRRSLLGPPTIIQPLGDVPLLTAGGTPKVEARVKAEWSARAEAIAKQAVLAGEGAPTRFEGLRRALAAWLEAPEGAGAKISLWVADAHCPEDPIFAVGSDVALNPASNSKLATAAFALAALGPDHRFETEIFQGADGRLYIKGGFDPTVGPETLDSIARSLLLKGCSICGDVVLDGSRLTGPALPAGFEKYGDQDWAYLAPVSALAIDKNLIQLVVRPGSRVGERAEVEANQGAFVLSSKVDTIAPSTPFSVGCDELDDRGTLRRGLDGRAIIEVTGTIALDYKKGKRLSMRSPDPSASFADQVKERFEVAGLVVRGRIQSGTTPEGLEPIFVHRSAPLREILAESIATSNAFDHEMLTLAAGLARSGRPSISLGEAKVALNHFLREELGLESAVLENGSGIGNLNLLSARDLGRILGAASADATLSPILDGLARPGRPGTLATRMLDTVAESVLAAKTGTAENGVALSGLVSPAGARPLVFSCLINDHQRGRSGARALLDALGIIASSFGAAV